MWSLITKRFVIYFDIFNALFSHYCFETCWKSLIIQNNPRIIPESKLEIFFIINPSNYFDTSLLIWRDGTSDLETLPADNPSAILKAPVCLMAREEDPIFTL